TSAAYALPSGYLRVPALGTDRRVACDDILEDRIGVAGHRHLGVDLPHDTVAVDQEGRPFDAHVLAAVHRLLLPYAVQLADLRALVSEQREVQLVLAHKPGVTRQVVRTHPDDESTVRSELAS